MKIQNHPINVLSRISLAALLFLTAACTPTENRELIQIELFPRTNEHTHGSTIVELPNGDLMAAWFQGSGERWADDVRIMGARLISGTGTVSYTHLTLPTIYSV